MTTTKTCSKCKAIKSASEFPANKLWCLSCGRSYNKAWRIKNAVMDTERKREWQRSIDGRLSCSKRRATRANIVWSLTAEEFATIVEQPCYYCRNVLGPKSETYSGLDRLDPKAGYIKANVVSCCGVCNMAKNDCLTPEETKAAMEAIIAFRRQMK